MYGSKVKHDIPKHYVMLFTPVLCLFRTFLSCVFVYEVKLFLVDSLFFEIIVFNLQLQSVS